MLPKYQCTSCRQPSGTDGSLSQHAGRADPGAETQDAAQGGQDCERPEEGDRVAEDAGGPISAAASRGSDGPTTSGGCGENSALATSGGDRIEAGRSAMRKGSASAAAHGERAPVSWAKITVADFGGTGVSDCAVGNTARGTSGSNPSRSRGQACRSPRSRVAAPIEPALASNRHSARRPTGANLRVMRAASPAVILLPLAAGAESKYPPAKPGALELGAPQRGPIPNLTFDNPRIQACFGTLDHAVGIASPLVTSSPLRKINGRASKGSRS